MPKSLVAFDTDRIKDYVFATDKLKEIRGASALLDRLNRERIPQIVKDIGGAQTQEIYANGGAGLFVVDSDKAAQVCQQVEYEYRTKTVSGSITSAVVEMTGITEKQALSLIRYKLRLAKDRAATNRVPFTHPFSKTCASCGTYYATNQSDEDNALLCESCLWKRDRNRDIKSDVTQMLEGTLSPQVNDTRLWRRLVAALRAVDYPVTEDSWPEDLDALGKMSKPSGYIGLIYADGDSMGKTIEDIDTLVNMGKFSNAVDDAVRESVLDAITEYLPCGGDEKWPFDIPMLGGDDLVMLTTADKAIEVALAVVEGFTTRTEQNYGQPLCLSASVVITHVNFPFNSLLHLAESGLKFAKKTAVKRRRGGERWDGGLINFLVVSSANQLDFKKYYNQVLTTKPASSQTGDKIYRTLRPYSVRELRELIDVRSNSEISNAPRSKLEQLRRAVWQSKQQAMIEGLLTLLHWRKEKQREEIYKYVMDVAQKHDGTAMFPWFQSNAASDEYYTPLLDLVELFDFIPPGGD